MVKATDLEFYVHVSRDSQHMTPKNFSKRERGQSYMTP